MLTTSRKIINTWGNIRWMPAGATRASRVTLLQRARRKDSILAALALDGGLDFRVRGLPATKWHLIRRQQEGELFMTATGLPLKLVWGGEEVQFLKSPRKSHRKRLLSELHLLWRRNDCACLLLWGWTQIICPISG